MIEHINFHIQELDSMKKYPKRLYFKGDTSLLNKKKISIIGSRKPNQYARQKTHELAQKLSHHGVCIVSGGAIGIDATAHKAAGASNTIVVAATGIDKRYPSINATLIGEVEKRGLVLSQFAPTSPSTKYNFVLRNELVVALGEVLIVSYADLNSGSMRSVEYAQKMGKKVYVLSHRIGESEATNKLLQENQAEAIYDIDTFVKEFSEIHKKQKTEDDFLLFCKSNPTYEETLSRFPARLFEAELAGEIEIINAKVYLVITL